MTLLEKLIEKQRLEGLSDIKFAARLGVQRSTWRRTRKGEIPLGMVILAGVVREYPSLTDDVLHVLAAYNQEAAA